MATTSNFRAFLLLMVLATIWSSSFSAIKIGVESLPPITLATLRIVLATVVLYGYMRLKGLQLPRSRRFWKLAFWVGLLGNGLPFTLIGWGEQTIDSGLAAILMAVMPLASLLLVHIYSTDEKLTVPKLMGIVTGFLGVVVLVGPETLKGLGGELIAQLAVAGGAVCYATANTVAIRMPDLPVVERSTAVLAMASLQLIPLSLFIDHPWALSPDLGSLAAAVYLGLFPTALAAIIYFHLITIRGATFIALNNYMVPALGVIWGWLFLSESLSAQGLAALALILAGIAIANSRPLRN